jgi:hypothetical protein
MRRRTRVTRVAPGHAIPILVRYWLMVPGGADEHDPLGGFAPWSIGDSVPVARPQHPDPGVAALRWFGRHGWGGSGLDEVQQGPGQAEAVVVSEACREQPRLLVGDGRRNGVQEVFPLFEVGIGMRRVVLLRRKWAVPVELLDLIADRQASPSSVVARARRRLEGRSRALRPRLPRQAARTTWSRDGSAAPRRHGLWPLPCRHTGSPPCRRHRSSHGQEAAAFISSMIFCSTTGLHFWIAYETGHTSPSSRLAASWNSRVE